MHRLKYLFLAPLFLMLSHSLFAAVPKGFSNDPLLPGTKVVAGKPYENEFFIIALTDKPAVKALTKTLHTNQQIRVAFNAKSPRHKTLKLYAQNKKGEHNKKLPGYLGAAFSRQPKKIVKKAVL